MSTGRFDDITADLRTLRAHAGEPSYGELVNRVIALRVARGMTEWEARVGRTTVYDAFRPGRRMLDPQLVGDLVRAMGGSEADIGDWIARCAAAAELQADPPAHPPDRERVTRRVKAPASRGPVRSRRFTLGLLVACLALNLAGRYLVSATHLPLYLDMVGTATAAIIIGPWEGAAVGAATSLIGVIPSGWDSIPFIPVEVVGALIWGYSVRRFRFGTSVPRYLLLNVIVAVACSVVAVPIIVWVDHGVTGDGADQITRTMHLFWHNLFASVASQNILTSLLDKMISGFVALGVAESLAGQLDQDRPRMTISADWFQAMLADARRFAARGRRPLDPSRI
jgi:energy-coupling factor transport system substrate-specific component